jgi:predicted phage-related endonuclease
VTAQVLNSYGIGASEIASACGISRYRSRFGLWLEKTGRRPQFAGNVHTRLGNLLEPRARQLYADATGLEVDGELAEHFSARRAPRPGHLVGDELREIPVRRH